MATSWAENLQVNCDLFIMTLGDQNRSPWAKNDVEFTGVRFKEQTFMQSFDLEGKISNDASIHNKYKLETCPATPNSHALSPSTLHGMDGYVSTYY